jgi:hypothetical protein
MIVDFIQPTSPFRLFMFGNTGKQLKNKNPLYFSPYCKTYDLGLKEDA